MKLKVDLPTQINIYKFLSTISVHVNINIFFNPLYFFSNRALTRLIENKTTWVDN